MRVIVCGGRDFSDARMLNDALNTIHAERAITMLWHGNARGADTLAGEWGKRNGVRVIPVPAEWSKHGKRAGPIRNQAMLGQGAKLVVAFPGGSGTADMVRRSRAAGVEVIEIGAP
jgi:hypothetical protein